jgi:8-oxo-dGTP pyrophosphatase MutT (NUDIX family)
LFGQDEEWSGMTDNIIRVVAALIRDDLGRMLVVRKRGTAAFMQPGGKRDAGEDDLTALGREIGEELGCRMVPGSAPSRRTSRAGGCKPASMLWMSAAPCRKPRSPKFCGLIQQRRCRSFWRR